VVAQCTLTSRNAGDLRRVPNSASTTERVRPSHLVRRYGRDTVGAGTIGLASVPFGATMVTGRVMGQFANGRLTNIAAMVATGWCCCSM
jgi:hypothetical protein